MTSAPLRRPAAAGADCPRAGRASQNILLDEPCSALDLGNQQVVLQLIGDLAHRRARTVLFTTHALQVASHTLLLLPEAGGWR